MKPSPSNQTLLFTSILLSFTAILLLSSCTGNNPTKADNTTPQETGAAKVTISVGKIGTLAKSTAIEMEHLIITITDKDKDTIYLADTSDLSGTGETTVKKTFPDLTAPEDYLLSVKTIDEEGEVIHNGSEEFSTIPGDTTDVAIDLDAKFSMLKVYIRIAPHSILTPDTRHLKPFPIYNQNVATNNFLKINPM